MGDDPFAVLNEAELQAMLQSELSHIFPEVCDLSLAPDVIERRPGAKLSCRRVYRETKVRPGRSGGEPDIIVLQNRAQTIHAKGNHAPSRFATPYTAIIETKIDATPKQILSGGRGRPISPSTLAQDVSKWQVGKEADRVYSIVYTAMPEHYQTFRDVITIRRTCEAYNGSLVASPDEISHCIAAYGGAVADVAADFREQPFSYLREKDFETALFTKVRSQAPISIGKVHPLRSQWWSKSTDVLGRRRRHDLVILGVEERELALEVELKTSHSDQHNWYRNRSVEGEFEAMQKLRDADRLGRAIFLMFRFGPARWSENAEALSARFPSIENQCVCSD